MCYLISPQASSSDLSPSVSILQIRRTSATTRMSHFPGLKCSLYLSMRQSKFPDERSNVLFVLSYMKGGSEGPWATQKINSILYPANPEEVTWAGFVSELDEMFVDPNCQATARRKLATLHQGDSSVEELIQEFEIHGPISRLGD